MFHATSPIVNKKQTLQISNVLAVQLKQRSMVNHADLIFLN